MIGRAVRLAGRNVNQRTDLRLPFGSKQSFEPARVGMNVVFDKEGSHPREDVLITEFLFDFHERTPLPYFAVVNRPEAFLIDVYNRSGDGDKHRRSRFVDDDLAELGGK